MHNGGQFYVGVVEDRNDPLMVGRVRVRVVGLHTYDKTFLPTEELPWALVMQPATGTIAMGSTATGPAEGTTVIVIFKDYPECQQPIIVGAIGGIPQETPIYTNQFEDTPMFKDGITPAGRPIPTTAAEATANQTGPIEGNNPALSSIIQQSQSGITTQSQLIDGMLTPNVATLGAVTEFNSIANGLGSSSCTIKLTNSWYGANFEVNLIGSGSYITAVSQFTALIGAAGQVGAAISQMMSTTNSLSFSGNQYGVTLSYLQVALAGAPGNATPSVLSSYFNTSLSGWATGTWPAANRGSDIAGYLTVKKDSIPSLNSIDFTFPNSYTAVATPLPSPATTKFVDGYIPGVGTETQNMSPSVKDVTGKRIFKYRYRKFIAAPGTSLSEFDSITEIELNTNECNGVIYPDTFDGMGLNDLIIIKFTTNGLDQEWSPSITVAEYGSERMGRITSLSTIAGSFDPKDEPSPNTLAHTIDSMSPECLFYVDKYDGKAYASSYPLLKKNTTYYLNIKNSLREAPAGFEETYSKADIIISSHNWTEDEGQIGYSDNLSLNDAVASGSTSTTTSFTTPIEVTPVVIEETGGNDGNYYLLDMGNLVDDTRPAVDIPGITVFQHPDGSGGEPSFAAERLWEEANGYDTSEFGLYGFGCDFVTPPGETVIVYKFKTSNADFARIRIYDMTMIQCLAQISISKNPGNFTDPIVDEGLQDDVLKKYLAARVFDFVLSTSYDPNPPNLPDYFDKTIVYLKPDTTYYLNIRINVDGTGSELYPAVRWGFAAGLFGEGDDADTWLLNATNPTIIPCEYEGVGKYTPGLITSTPTPSTTSEKAYPIPYSPVSAFSSLGVGTISPTTSTSYVAQLTAAYKIPSNIDVLINGPQGNFFSSFTAASLNIGNIQKITPAKPIGTIDSTTFTGAKNNNEVKTPQVAEGSTPPILGSYGGPNFAGGEEAPRTPETDIVTLKNVSSGSIPLEPPPDWKGDRSKASQGIAALVRACKKFGFTEKAQQASVLGIVGGECGWIPQEEGCQYSDPKRLCEVFPSTFKDDLERAKQYSNWKKGNKGSPADFFNFVYDPSNNGRQLGNIYPGDGGKFYGRGFIQLTGRSNYERYKKLTGHDIINNPDLLNTDYDVSAEIAVRYLIDRVNVKGVPGTAHPAFFYACKKAVGNNTPDIAIKKLKYYEYFYGTMAPESYGTTLKLAGNANPPTSFYGAVGVNEPTKTGSRSEFGFSDPHGKYPLKRYINEPETNRLARGVIKNTVVPLKESQRTIGVPIANNGGSFSQPSIPYGAKYPYNHVVETESGHIQEFDDTPGYERIHTYHRSGTFTEVDTNGTQVNKIVGDGYIIMDRNGFITIAGNCNVTINGKTNLFCRSDANIEVSGSTELTVGGNLDMRIARDMNIAVGGSFSLWANKGLNLQAKQMGHILTQDKLFISTDKELHVKAKEKMFVAAGKESHVDIKDKLFVTTAKDLHLTSLAKTYITSKGDMHTKVSGTHYLEASSGIHNKAGENIYLKSLNIHNKVQDGFFIDTKDINANATGLMSIKIANDIGVQSKNLFVKSDTDARISATNIHLKADDTLYLSGAHVSGKAGNATIFDSSGGTLTVGSASMNSVFLGARIDLNGVAGSSAGTPTAASPASPTAASDAKSATGATKAKIATKALIHGMITPAEGTPLYLSLDTLTPPPLLGEDVHMYELPTENSPVIQDKTRESMLQNGINNTFQTESTSPPGSQASPVEVPPVNDETFTADYKLSEHFTLGMMFDGGFNVKHKLVAQNGLTVQQIVQNLKSVAENILEKYIPYMPGGISGYGKIWRISSGYRMGTNGSDHSKGQACDVALIGGPDRRQKHYDLIQELAKAVPYDQLILEYADSGQTWIHCSYRGAQGRKMGFTMNNHAIVNRNQFVLLA